MCSFGNASSLCMEQVAVGTQLAVNHVQQVHSLQQRAPSGCVLHSRFRLITTVTVSPSATLLSSGARRTAAQGLLGISSCATSNIAAKSSARQLTSLALRNHHKSIQRPPALYFRYFGDSNRHVSFEKDVGTSSFLFNCRDSESGWI